MASSMCRHVYAGPGTEGSAEGDDPEAARVVALEYRPMYLHKGAMHCPCDKQYEPLIPYAGDQSGEAITAGGAWDVKHVLGEVDVAPDGSCAFEAPANNGVYFQLLDERGRCVQTMRSWTMVMPGETNRLRGLP